MSSLKFQNPKKAKKERIDTLFKKACLLSRIFLHNPPKSGRIALLIEYDKKWKVFLSEEGQKWPINFKKLCPAEVKYVKDIRTEKEAREDRAMEERLVGDGDPYDANGVVSTENDSELGESEPGDLADPIGSLAASPSVQQQTTSAAFKDCARKVPRRGERQQASSGNGRTRKSLLSSSQTTLPRYLRRAKPSREGPPANSLRYRPTRRTPRA